jgi:hypothetical protein
VEYVILLAIAAVPFVLLLRRMSRRDNLRAAPHVYRLDKPSEAAVNDVWDLLSNQRGYKLRRDSPVYLVIRPVHGGKLFATLFLPLIGWVWIGGLRGQVRAVAAPDGDGCRLTFQGAMTDRLIRTLGTAFGPEVTAQTT